MISYLYLLDVTILKIINLSFRSVFLNNLSIYVSYMGLIYFGLIIAAILYLFGGKKGKNVSKKLVITVILTSCITLCIKYIILRPRPFTQLASLVVLNIETDSSFPSGHTSMSTAIAYSLGKNYGHTPLFMIIPILVGLSRMYIGVHYPSDVMGGFFVGIIVVYLCEYLCKNKKIVNFIKIEKL